MVRFFFAMVCCFSIDLSSYAQALQCNCIENLKTTILKTEQNYAGFPIKVNAKTKATYNALTRQLSIRADTVTNPRNCFYIIKNYVTFFKDRHFDFSYSSDTESEKEYSDLTEAYFRNTLKPEALSPVEGIWINPDSTLKIAIRQTSKNILKGIIVKSSDPKIALGLVYCTLTKNDRGYSFIKYNVFTTGYPARQHGRLLQLWNMELWGKEYPGTMNQKEREELATWRNYNFGLAFRKLNAGTAYLKLPSFNRDNLVQKLVNSNDSIIRNTENLIVDLRGNGGGNTGWSYLLPYFLTNTIVQGNNYLRLSPDNNKHMLTDIEPVVKNPVPEEMKKYFTPQFMAAYKKAYLEIPSAKGIFYPIPTIIIPVDSVLKKPRNIALVFDDLCGSSTEYFFYISRQSSRIKRYGTATLGMMDYVGMFQPTKLPFDKYHLVIPDTKSAWTDTKPIDSTGFIPENDLRKLPQSKWIDYIVSDLENK